MKKNRVSYAICACLSFALVVSCGQTADLIDAGSESDDVQIVRVDSSTPDTARADTHVADTRMPDANQPDTRMPDAARPDTRSQDTVAADVTAQDVRVDASATDTFTAADTTPVDAFTELTCSGALSCTLSNCGDANRTCAAACGARVCENNVALWDALFTCIDTNCSVACETSLSSGECIACRQEFCQTEFTNCSSSPLCE